MMTPRSQHPSQLDEQVKELEEDHFLSSDSRLYRIPFFTDFWHCVLGTSALLDFLSTVLPRYFLPHHEDELIEEKENPFIFWKRRDVTYELDPVLDQKWYHDVLEWFKRNGPELSMIFSVLWFVHAFVTARRVRLKKLREVDRKRLLKRESGSKELCKSDSTLNSIYEENWVKGGWGHFVCHVSIQLLLLPVGFYFLCYHVCRGTFDGDLDPDEFITIEYSGTDEVPGFHETMSAHTTQSVAYALIHHFSIVLSRVAGAEINAVRKRIKRFGMRITRRMAFMAIRNPKRFARRLRKTLTIIRWAKYLFPLVGAGNKLMSNVKDLMKRRRQQRQATRAARMRRKIWKQMSEEERKEAAAMLIQKRWRAYKTKQAVSALKLITGEKETIAALRMQKVFKAMLARARERLQRKREELRKLQHEERNRMGMLNQRLSAAERRRMYQLQEEVGAEEKKTIGQKFLLRPNTKFAVVWKVLFVICVILEISKLAAKPLLKKYKKQMTKTAEPATAGQVIQYKLIPTPIDELKICSNGQIMEESLPRGPRITKPMRRWKEKRRIAKLRRDNDRPWYCDNGFAIVAQSIYIETLRFILEETVLVIGAVCFLDVPVTFWTGEFDGRGMLVPKPFFKRWILPGLTLQLLVNPAMGEVSKVVRRAIQRSMEIGPVRVARWSIALFFPLFEQFVLWLEYAVWLPLTIHQNYLTWQTT